MRGREKESRKEIALAEGNLGQVLPITIFHTNDMHGRLEAISRLTHLARRQRIEAEAAGRTVFFWDAGDAADRRIRICSLTKGAAFSPLLNAMGITVQAVGNAISLTYGPQALALVAERANFPLLAANLRNGDGPLVPGVRGHTLIPLPAGPPLGLFGLTAPWSGAYEVFGLYMPDIVATARDEVAALKGAGAGAIIFLSHLGLPADRKVAERVPEIELIIGAHSHDLLPAGELVNGTLIAQAGDYAKYLGIVECLADPHTGRLIEPRARVVEVPPNEPLDPRFETARSQAELEADAVEAQPMGVLQAALDLDHFQECGVGNFAADALRDRWGADAAILASGLFHHHLPAGTVTLGDLNRACFSTANPCLTELRGDQILAALERGLDPAIYAVEHGAMRGTPVGIPQISGLVVDSDRGAPVGARVRAVQIGGNPLIPARRYRVAHTDAETNPEIGYLKLDDDQTTEHEVPTIVREALAEYLAPRSPLPHPGTGRWKPR